MHYVVDASMKKHFLTQLILKEFKSQSESEWERIAGI